MYGSILFVHETLPWFSTWLTYLNKTGISAVQDLLVGDNIPGALASLFVNRHLVGGWRKEAADAFAKAIDGD